VKGDEETNIYSDHDFS